MTDMTKRFLLTSILFYLLSMGIAEAQSRQQKKGDEAFRDHQYQRAIAYYEKALPKTKQANTADRIKHRLAMIYNAVHDYSVAAVYYEQIANSRYAERNGSVLLEYASVLLKTGQPEKAGIIYEKYLVLEPGSATAITGLASIEMINANAGLKGTYEVEHPEAINSSADDFGVSYLSRNYRQIIFTSNRESATGKSLDDWTGGRFSDLFESSLDRRNNWSNPLPADRNNFVNTEDHEGTPHFAYGSNTLYYTHCPRVVEDRAYCQIMSSARRGSGWSKPELVLRNRSANTGHPTLSSDELTIYFASGGRDGMGKKDIWMASRKARTQPFGEAINLGELINTVGEEKFPFLRNDTLLYFASDGHPGFGGLDIYYTTIDKQGVFSKPVNLLSPINSQADDFGIVFHPETEEGFLASNRQGGKGGDDIYTFTKRTLLFSLDGKVTDVKTRLGIAHPVLYLIAQKGDSIRLDGSIIGVYERGEMPVDPPQEYDLVASAEDYFAKRISFSTKNLTADKRFTFDFELEPIPETPIILPEVLYDLGKWNIKPQFYDSLSVLFDVLTTNPNLVIEIRSHTDSRNTHAFNDDLSQKRAQSAIDFLIEKGIEPERLQARGYGKRVPRILERDLNYNGFRLNKGSVLDDNFINRLPNNTQREQAHQLNRRTEFSVISKNFVASQAPVYSRAVRIITDLDRETIGFERTQEQMPILPTSLNEFGVPAILDQTKPSSQIGADLALQLLSAGYITRSNFDESVEQAIVDDKVQQGALLTIDRLRIGSITLRDISFVVGMTGHQELLIASDILSLFKSFTIDQENQTITIEY